MEKQDTCSLAVGLLYEQLSRSVMFPDAAVPVAGTEYSEESSSGGRETDDGELGSGYTFIEPGIYRAFLDPPALLEMAPPPLPTPPVEPLF